MARQGAEENVGSDNLETTDGLPSSPRSTDPPSTSHLTAEEATKAWVEWARAIVRN